MSLNPRMVLPLFTLAVALSPVAAGEEESPVIAEHDGIVITVADWEHLLRQDPRLAGISSPLRDEAEFFVRTTIRDEILRRWDLREAERLGLATSEAGQARLLLSELLVLAQWAQQRGLPSRIDVSDTEIAREFEARRDEFQQPDWISFRHMHFDLAGLASEEVARRRELAVEICERLREDPIRFAALAAEHADAGQREPGFVFGPAPPEDLQPSMREPLWQLREGEVSEPIEIGGGLHIVQVAQRIPRVRLLAEVRPRLRDQILRRRTEERIEALIASGEAELGLTLHESPRRLEAETPIASGAMALTGEDLLLGLGIDLASAPEEENLERMIGQAHRLAVLATWARQHDALEAPEVQSALEEGREAALLQLVAERRWDALEPVDGRMERAHYQQNIEHYTEPVRMRVRVLEVTPHSGSEETPYQVLRRAEAIRAEWEAGRDFEDLMDANSQSDISPHWIEPLGEDHDPFRVIADLATGEVSQPLRLPNGFALAEVLAVERDVVIPFGELQGQIHESLVARVRNAADMARQREVLEATEWTIPEEIIQRHLSASEEISVR